MNREEAIAKGLEVHDTQHSIKRRNPWHDYHRKGTYMLALVVDGRAPILGELWGKAGFPAEFESGFFKAQQSHWPYHDEDIVVENYIEDATVDYFMEHTDTKFICIERALDSAKKFNLKKKMDDKFFAF